MRNQPTGGDSGIALFTSEAATRLIMTEDSLSNPSRCRTRRYGMP
jgi:hypothetical protein